MMLSRKSLLILNTNLVKNCRLFSTEQRAFHEVKVPVPWGHVAGRWWEPWDKRPILAIHGWQDNCGTFNRLIPMLNDSVGVLAIDLPGHGYSSPLPSGMYYHNMNYPILIRQISNYFKWPKTSLMGHSLGGISAYMYTMLFPESVDFLVCIDGVKPLYKKNNGPRMAEGIQELLKYDAQMRSTEEPPSYPLDVLKKKLAALNKNSISIEHCHHILERNIAPSKNDPDKYCFTRDPRLKARLILNWSQKELVEGAYRVTPPLCMIKFTESGYYEEKQNFYEILEVLKKTSKDPRVHYVDGPHHTHLNNPETVNNLINNFVGTHNTEDRSVGGIKSDIISAEN
ncbi:Abhydrolase 6 and/or Hydrolase 4 domain containing protein [Asbolus verrucosus]|uniref:Abhydrolase 6 and/or Hydrolase 4 domain containing protein n=1 Tax=Asbolus verrucosus TaxID=1661398 RepID=A0A482VQ02_ASBVE|nr:Abhydrolase 6 and/or Hydrolase 4 domain containing protein [Asbolus verrucosus]